MHAIMMMTDSTKETFIAHELREMKVRGLLKTTGEC